MKSARLTSTWSPVSFRSFYQRQMAIRVYTRKANCQDPLAGSVFTEPRSFRDYREVSE